MSASCFTWSTPAVEDKYALAALMTILLNAPYEVDHRQPLAKGGPHINANLEVISRTQNRSKHDKSPN